MTDVTVAPMTDRHAEAVLAIYQAGMDAGDATFETVAPGWETFIAKRPPAYRFVALDPAGSAIGWTAASPASDRCVYAGVVHHSVYVAPDHYGQGVGRHVGRMGDVHGDAGSLTAGRSQFVFDPAAEFEFACQDRLQSAPRFTRRGKTRSRSRPRGRRSATSCRTGRSGARPPAMPACC